MSKRMHARVSARRKVEFQHAEGKGEGILLDLSLKGCRIKGVYTGSSGTRCGYSSGFPTTRNR